MFHEFTRFKAMKNVRKSDHFVIDPTNQDHIDLLNGLCKQAHDMANQPLYWGFATYSGKHNETDLQETNCVVLEYPSTKRSAVESRIRQLEWHTIAITTERDDQNTVTFVLPLDFAIMTGLEYTRAATVAATEIGVQPLDGKAITFLFKPVRQAKCYMVPGKLLSKGMLNREGWFEFDKIEQQAKPEPKPSKHQRIASHLRALADLFEEDTSR